MVSHVAVPALHGTLITIDVKPSMPVWCFKQACMDESPWHLTPLKVNADLGHLVNNCNIDNLIGFRLATWDGQLLQDGETIGSQVSTIDTLFKLVFMKQYDLDHNDLDMVMEFANLAHGTSSLCVTMPLYGIQFEVHPVFGGGSRSNQILGLLHQHMDSAAHCRAMKHGVDPRKIDYNCPVSFVDFLQPQI